MSSIHLNAIRHLSCTSRKPVRLHSEICSLQKSKWRCTVLRLMSHYLFGNFSCIFVIVRIGVYIFFVIFAKLEFMVLCQAIAQCLEILYSNHRSITLAFKGHRCVNQLFHCYWIAKSFGRAIATHKFFLQGCVREHGCLLVFFPTLVFKVQLELIVQSINCSHNGKELINV